MDVVGQPHKQLGSEAYYQVMTNAPMIFMTLNGLFKIIMIGHETSIQTNKIFSTPKIVPFECKYCFSSTQVVISFSSQILVLLRAGNSKRALARPNTVHDFSFANCRARVGCCRQSGAEGGGVATRALVHGSKKDATGR